MTELNLIDKFELRYENSSYSANICKNFLWKTGIYKHAYLEHYILLKIIYNVIYWQ